MTFRILQGDNRDVLKTLADNSIDAIVTDPPYGIAFLGKDWDSKKASETTSKQAALHNLPSGMALTSLANDLEFQYWMRDVFAECLRVLKPGGYLLAFSAARTYHHMALAAQTAGYEVRDQLMWIYGSGFPKSQDIGRQLDKKKINNDWSGWGTALKPAHEPIVLARKPTKLTFAKNVQQWGTGALNIDATRVERPGEEDRFPSNVIGEFPDDIQKYFYCPKVSRKERHTGFDDAEATGNNHPTVKPVALMEYLIKLVTPPGGTVLDPFNGSGSTGMAAVALGCEYIGIELDPAYVKIAETRISAWQTRDQSDNTFDLLFEEQQND
jgi:DNA modification methylase